jgi:hypothetical protein
MSLASIKRKLQVGAKIQMVRHDWFNAGQSPQFVPDKIAGVREVVRAQSNAVQFSGGSWLYFDKASRLRETPTGFEVDLDDNGTFNRVMQYEWRA